MRLSLVIAGALLIALARTAAADCRDLLRLTTATAEITLAEPVAAGSFTPPGAEPIPGLPAFCRVAATLRPTSDSNIRIEVWMPEAGWNGRFLGTGNGGLAGKISYGSLSRRTAKRICSHQHRHGHVHASGLGRLSPDWPS